MKPSSNRTLLAAAVVTILSAETAFAQLEEVIVTAERREASLQDTPISIEALTEKQIRERGITNNLDLIAEVTGIQGYGSPQGGSSTAFVIRGIGDGSPNISLDPASARYIDGVYISKNAGSSVDVIDLARIEVLKGPQGTLFGRNSTSGAINYISKAPGDEFGMELRATAGNYGQAASSVRIDLPVSDSFRTSVSYFQRERDAFWDNTNPNLGGFNSVDRDGLRAAIQWDASDRLSMDLIYSESNVNGEYANHEVVSGLNPGGYASVQGIDPLGVPINSATRLQTIGAIAGGLELALMNPALAQAPFAPAIQQYIGWANDYIAWGQGILNGMDMNPRTGSSDVESFSDVANESVTFKLNFELTDNIDLRYIYGQREMNDYSESDLDGMDNSLASGVQHDLVLSIIGGALFSGLGFPAPSITPGQVCLAPGFGTANCPLPLLDVTDARQEDFGMAMAMIGAINEAGGAGVFDTQLSNEYEQTSHEIQLVGSGDTTDWAVGAYWWEDDGMSRNLQNATFPIASSSSRGFDVGGEAFSVFGEATWRTSDQWSFTAGLRYTEEDKYMTYRWRDFASGTQGLAGYIGAAVNEAYTLAYLGQDISIPRNLTGGYVFELADIMMIPETAGVYGNYNKQSFDNLSGRFVAKYDVSDDMNLYASYTTGYRAGGYNGGAFNSEAGMGDAFSEETIASMELGMKSTLMDGRMRLNGALFNYTYDDVQVSTVKSDPETGISTDVDNAAKQSTTGLELQVIWALSDRVTMTGNYAFIDRDYDEFPLFDGIAVQPTQGLTPENAAYLAFDWDMMRRGNDSLSLRVSGNYQDSTVSITTSSSIYSVTNPATGQLLTTPVDFQQPRNQSRTLVDARLTWNREMDSGRNFSVSAWGKNITEQEYRTFGFNLGSALGLPLHQWGDPATYGLDFTFNL